MATKADFTAQEWSEVLGSVMLVGMAVTLADPSGLIGMTKEGFASGSALLEAKNDPNANELIKAVVSDFGTSEGRTAARGVIKSKVAGKPASEMKAIILETLRQTAAVLDAKAPLPALWKVRAFRTALALAESIALAMNVEKAYGR